jgi:hypothetical protein
MTNRKITSNRKTEKGGVSGSLGPTSEGTSEPIDVHISISSSELLEGGNFHRIPSSWKADPKSEEAAIAGISLSLVAPFVKIPAS